MYQDYDISDEKKELFGALLDTLYEIDRVCKKNDIVYYAFAGTLLGAVRHGGFIPWDDDIDLLMLRKDYDKFVEVCNRDIDSKYFLQTTLNENGYYRYPARVRKNDTTYLTAQEIKKIKAGKTISYNCGIFISIFPLDTKPKSDSACKRQKKMARFRNQILVSNAYTVDKRFLPLLIKGYCSIVGYKNIYKRLVRSYSKFSDKRGELVHFPAIYNHAPRTYYYTEDFDKVVTIPFEGFDLPCPVGYKRCLSIPFGDDYMTPPPFAERGKHHHGEYMNLHTGFKEILSMERSELIKLIDNV